jgi:hypothetical protein
MAHQRQRHYIGDESHGPSTEPFCFNCGLWVIHPIDRAVSGARNMRTDYTSYTFWYHNGNYRRLSPLCHHPYPCSTSIRRGTNLYTSQDDKNMASMGLLFRDTVLQMAQQLPPEPELLLWHWRRLSRHDDPPKVLEMGTGWRLPTARTVKLLEQQKTDR